MAYDVGAPVLLVLGAWRLLGIEWAAFVLALIALVLAVYAIAGNAQIRRDFGQTMDDQERVAGRLREATAAVDQQIRED